MYMRQMTGRCRATTTYECNGKTEWTKGEEFNFALEGRFYRISNENNCNRFPYAVFKLNFEVI